MEDRLINIGKCRKFFYYSLWGLPKRLFQNMMTLNFQKLKMSMMTNNFLAKYEATRFPLAK